MPNPRSSASSPIAESTPSPMPMSDDTRPTIAASPRTERNTCRRLAPTIRSSASSRVRCPTMIEKVLRMVKAPTKSEMKAKTSSAVEKNDSAWLIWLVASLATVCPVTTSTPSRQDLGDVPLDDGLVGPGLCHHVDGVELADLCRTRSAQSAGRTRRASRRPGCRRVPKRAMPVMVKVWDGPARRILTRSPTWKSYFWAVPASMTTSSAVVGRCPGRCG